MPFLLTSLYTLVILAVATVPTSAAPQLLPGLPSIPLLPSLPLPSLPLPSLPLPSLPLLPPILPPIIPAPRPTCAAGLDGPQCCQSITSALGDGTLSGLLGSLSGLGLPIPALPAGIDPTALVSTNCVATTTTPCAGGSAAVCCTSLPIDLLGIIGGLLPIGGLNPLGNIGLNCADAQVA